VGGAKTQSASLPPWIEELYGKFREQMTLTQARYEQQASSGRAPSPAYRVGGLAWLNAKNIATEHPSKKLFSKNLSSLPNHQDHQPTCVSTQSIVRMHDVFTLLSYTLPRMTNPRTSRTTRSTPAEVVEQQKWNGKEKAWWAKLFGKTKRLQVKWYDIIV
jgi:hypothetical protein